MFISCAHLSQCVSSNLVNKTLDMRSAPGSRLRRDLPGEVESGIKSGLNREGRVSTGDLTCHAGAGRMASVNSWTRGPSCRPAITNATPGDHLTLSHASQR